MADSFSPIQVIDGSGRECTTRVKPFALVGILTPLVVLGGSIGIGMATTNARIEYLERNKVPTDDHAVLKERVDSLKAASDKHEATIKEALNDLRKDVKDLKDYLMNGNRRP
jgi:hypothetical protein